MRVLHASDTFRPRSDGVAISLAALIAAARESGEVVGLVAPGEPPRTDAFHVRLPAVPSHLGVPISLNVRRSMASALNRFRPDLIHIHTFGPAGLGAAGAARRSGIPFVVTWHTDVESYLRHIPLPRTTLGALTLAAAKAGALSGATTMRSLAKLSKPSLALIESVADVMSASALCIGPSPKGIRLIRRYRAKHVALTPHMLPDTAPQSRQPSRMVCVSRLSREKNVEAVLRMMTAMKDRTDANLDIFGTGPHRNSLEKTALSLGLGAVVRFRGEIPNDRLRRELANYVLMIHPGLTDVSPMVLVEACSAALPVVVLDDQLADQIPRGGVAVARDPRDLANTATALLANPDRRLGLSDQMRQSARAWPTAQEIAAVLYADYRRATELRREP